MASPKRPYAVFDIDGTLIRWQLYHALSDSLAKNGVIDRETYQAVLLARNNWKSRHSLDSFTDYENAMIRLVSNAIVGLNYVSFCEVCVNVVSRYQDQVYTYTRDLIADLRQHHYLIFAVSASPKELVGLVANYYSFDDFGASEYEVLKGKLTGNKHLLIGSAKTHYLKELIIKHQATQSGSIGVGDTLGDASMLAHVERPIAFNPTKELFDLAATKGWEVVVERKNVVYQLKYEDGKYFLAPTDSRQTLIL